MDKLTNYIENVFASLPKTKEVVEMKLNMLEHMQDKYNALLVQGKNENEAFGIVVAGFGSIEEIKAELGIRDT
ncbi:MAG: permease prefix domain 1-containing protein [Clostridia bacterium]|jgi:hypothetical protein|nr:permease prefix domain 1-containing protein [Clostridia bacterium]MDD4572022.1 permease prefix domain 1-containing protein [Clostridia bacterium]